MPTPPTTYENLVVPGPRHPSGTAADPATARDTTSDSVRRRDPLLGFAAEAAADPTLIDRLPLDSVERTWIRLSAPDGCDAWLIGWPPGSRTGWHDHGGSRGAFLVVRGELVESTVRVRTLPTEIRERVPMSPRQPVPLRLTTGQGRPFGPAHVHDVRNDSTTRHAVSVHFYSPALPLMRRYEIVDNDFLLDSIERAEDW
ncbi:cysteine dioxygenase [Embleya sp. NPDC001921]